MKSPIVEPFTARQQLSVVVASILLFLVVIGLVRARRLKEEYTWLWLFASITVLIFSLRLTWLVALTHWLGAEVTASGAYFLGFIFLVLINLHFSVKNSELTERLKILAQQSALLDAELHELLIPREPTDENPGRGSHAPTSPSSASSLEDQRPA